MKNNTCKHCCAPVKQDQCYCEYCGSFLKEAVINTYDADTNDESKNEKARELKLALEKQKKEEQKELNFARVTMVLEWVVILGIAVYMHLSEIDTWHWLLLGIVSFIPTLQAFAYSTVEKMLKHDTSVWNKGELWKMIIFEGPIVILCNFNAINWDRI